MVSSRIERERSWRYHRGVSINTRLFGPKHGHFWKCGSCKTSASFHPRRLNKTHICCGVINVLRRQQSLIPLQRLHSSADCTLCARRQLTLYSGRREVLLAFDQAYLLMYHSASRPSCRSKTKYAARRSSVRSCQKPRPPYRVCSCPLSAL